jgi:hypothetical protein
MSQKKSQSRKIHTIFRQPHFVLCPNCLERIDSTNPYGYFHTDDKITCPNCKEEYSIAAKTDTVMFQE